MSPEHKNHSISIVIPVYNEAGAVAETLRAISHILNSHQVNYEIIAVNDGSKDNSGAILDALEIPNLRVIHHVENRGYGSALKAGIKAAQYPWILISDSDGTYPIDRIPDLIAHLDTYDMVVASREKIPGQKVHDTFSRKIGRGIVRGFASYITGHSIKDINSGMRIFKKEDAEQFWHLFPERFSFTSTSTVASLNSGKLIKYVPIDYYKRAGNSSIKPAKDFVGFMSLLTRLAIYYKPLRVFVPLSIILLILGFVVLVGSWLFLGRIMDATFSILIIASLQTLFFGLIAEMIVKRFYRE
jgi:glycosyltransferase involved in cell wall biosynthesis